MTLKSYGKTDTGRVRESNQDAFICGCLSENAFYMQLKCEVKYLIYQRRFL